MNLARQARSRLLSDAYPLMLHSTLAFAVSTTLLLCACADVPEDTIESRAPPPEAIEVDEGLYMVPIGKDEGGCPQYSAWSRTRGVPAVVYYRQPDGEFTMFRSMADCGEN